MRSHLQLPGCSLSLDPSLRLPLRGMHLLGSYEGVVTSDEGTIRPDYTIRRFPEMRLRQLRACFSMRDVRAVARHRTRDIRLVETGRLSKSGKVSAQRSLLLGELWRLASHSVAPLSWTTTVRVPSVTVPAHHADTGGSRHRLRPRCRTAASPAGTGRGCGAWPRTRRVGQG